MANGPRPLKSKKAYRTIGIPGFLVEELAAHLAAYRSESDLSSPTPREAPSTTTASAAATGNPQ